MGVRTDHGTDEEGSDLDFNIGLYFYEKLCAKVLESPEGAQWRNDPKYKPSMPEMLTAIVRKQELREKVDVNFDGRISFLEYLLCMCPSPRLASRSTDLNHRPVQGILQPGGLLRTLHESLRT